MALFSVVNVFVVVLPLFVGSASCRTYVASALHILRVRRSTFGLVAVISMYFLPYA